MLSPYQHELNGAGNNCADDCPACRWVREQEFGMRERMGFPPKHIDLTPEDYAFLADAKITWGTDLHPGR